MGCEDGVDKGGLSESGLACMSCISNCSSKNITSMYKEPQMTRTNANDVELESALQELALNLRCDAVETNMALWEHRLGCLRGRHLDVFVLGRDLWGYIAETQIRASNVSRKRSR